VREKGIHTHRASGTGKEGRIAERKHERLYERETETVREGEGERKREKRR